jgi:Flp pilus assembly protein TadD
MSKRYTEALLPLVLVLLAGCSSNPGRPAVTAPASAAIPSPATQDEYRQAITLMRAEQWQDASRLLETITVRQPGLSGPWLNLGISRVKTGDLDTAETALRKAIEVNTHNIDAYNQLGILYRYQARHEEARVAYETALGIAPDTPDIHWNLGILNDLYLDNPVLALQHYEHYQQLTATDDRQLQAWIDDLRTRTRKDTITAEARP